MTGYHARAQGLTAYLTADVRLRINEVYSILRPQTKGSSAFPLPMAVTTSKTGEIVSEHEGE